MSLSSLQGATPINLSVGPSFIAIFPFERIFVKSDNLFLLTLPDDVAKTTDKLSHFSVSLGIGIIVCIFSSVEIGNKLIIAFPIDVGDVTGNL